MLKLKNSQEILSPMEQRLEYARTHLQSKCINFSETAPVWPTHPLMSLSVAHQLYELRYPPCQGQPELINAIIKREHIRYDLTLTNQNVLITNGALHGLSLIFRKFINAKSTVICQAPVYQGIADILCQMQCNIIYVDMNDSEKLSRVLQENSGVALIYINTPHNPTGSIMSRLDLQKLVDYCSHNQAILVVDAVYDDFVFDHHAITHPFTLQKNWKNLFYVNSVSKNYGAASLRIGWIQSAPSNIARLVCRLEQECIAVSMPSQLIASKLIMQGNTILLNLVNKNRLLVNKLLSYFIPPPNITPPAGGTWYFIKIPYNDNEFATYMLTQHHLMVATSESYAACEPCYIRIPFGYSEEIIRIAISKIELGLQQYRHTKNRRIDFAES